MTERGRRWLRLDALNRAWRTVLQGVVATGLGAAGDVVLQALMRGGVSDWSEVLRTAQYAGGTAALMALLAYLHRAKLDPSPVPSSIPPAPPSELTAASAVLDARPRP